MKATCQFSIFLIVFFQPIHCGFIFDIGSKLTDTVAGAVKTGLKVPDSIVSKVGETLLPSNSKPNIGSNNNLVPQLDGIPGKFNDFVGNFQKYPGIFSNEANKQLSWLPQQLQTDVSKQISGLPQRLQTDLSKQINGFSQDSSKLASGLPEQFQQGLSKLSDEATKQVGSLPGQLIDQAGGLMTTVIN